MPPLALALLELGTVAAGLRTIDAMVKRAPLDGVRAGTVQPGRYLVIVTGAVAAVEEAFAAGVETAGAALLDRVFLPHVDPAVVAALGGGRAVDPVEALGVVETRTSAAIVGAADAGVKAAAVVVVELRLGDGLDGRGVVLFAGDVAGVEAAVAAAVASLPAPESLVDRTVIARFDPLAAETLADDSRFGPGSARAAR